MYKRVKKGKVENVRGHNKHINISSITQGPKIVNETIENQEYILIGEEVFPIVTYNGIKYYQDGGMLMNIPFGITIHNTPSPKIVKQNPRLKAILKKKTMIKEFPEPYAKSAMALGRDDHEHSFGMDFERQLEQPQRMFTMRGGKVETLKIDDFEMFGHSHPDEFYPTPSTGDLRTLRYLEPEFIIAGSSGKIIILNIKNKTKYNAWLKRVGKQNAHSSPFSRAEFEKAIKSPEYEGLRPIDYVALSEDEKSRKLYYDMTGVEMVPYEKGIKVEMKDNPITKKQIPSIPKSYLKKWREQDIKKS